MTDMTTPQLANERIGTSPASQVQVRRAWLILGSAFVVFVMLAAAAIGGGVWVYRHATVPEAATLEVISGEGALVRSPGDGDWRLATNGTRVHEGDRISTALGTVVNLTLFDGSTVEIAEDTVVRVTRMRSSRFLDRTKLVVLEPLRGIVYLGMEPRGRYQFAETIVRVGETQVSMADGEAQPEAGAFLVEVRRRGDAAEIRAAVLRGAATIDAPGGSLRLVRDQQARVSANGEIGAIESAVRELIVNGTFSDGLAGWVEFQGDEGEPAGDGSSGASVELVRETTTRGEGTAVEFLRDSTRSNAVQTGIRQRIGKTLRVYSSLLLDFEVKISDQRPAGGGASGSAFPLIVEVNYLDVRGQERRWSHGYYVVADPTRPVDDEFATRIDRDQWQRIAFDLRNLDPLPRQVTSIVVYASGQSYQTRVANLSLTSSELFDAE